MRTQMRTGLALVTLACGGVLALGAGCVACSGGGGGGGGPVPAGSVETAAPAAPAPAPAPAATEPAEREEKKAEAEYSYNPIGKRDPFRSFTSVEVVQRDTIVASELQNWELDQLRLVGIMWGVDEPVAMVEDPKGKGHIIQHGDLIGKKWGKVTQIKSDGVIITEEFRDPIENRPITNEYAMQLPDPFEESD